MASKRNVRRHMCEGKCTYKLQADAVYAAKKAIRLYRSNLHAYFCPFCKGYHVGHPVFKAKRTRKKFELLGDKSYGYNS
jgi:hypothetical protein